MEPVPVITWSEDTIRLLDQRVLPERESFIRCGDVETLAEAIRTLAVRGAPAIGIAAAFGCVLAASNTPSGPEYSKGFLKKVKTLSETRPTAVNLFNCLKVQTGIFQQDPVKEKAVPALLSSARRMKNRDLDSSRKMGSFGADLLPLDAVVLTHCNAGGLATAGLGTALAVVYEAGERGILKQVYADETRPLLQGARLTSWELSRAGIPVKVIPDSAAASLLRRGEVSAVIVGSDRIVLNGDAANKIGTYPLALAAAEHSVPFYVVAPLSTFDTGTATGEDIVIEERGREELAELGGRRLLPDGVEVWNPAFDVTPASLITAIICEKGVIEFPNPDRIARVLSRNS
ncbi:MAG: S-methyl-5-thioribose-1-phosphate isomerase [Candidatus Aegiribacteria sp.]|nr:S-methyl-5-thioribose-1-phosphate isomerase [Candidatus Aegiribacteria sp.]MBD3294696.1 S-methyl-5-thioribose-1-phosphate isomerase [Candidatus Fermentibacteria bacterium]